MLAECKSLRTTKLRSLLLDLSKATLTGISMFLSCHLHVILREASKAMIHEEGAISPVQNIHFRVGK